MIAERDIWFGRLALKMDKCTREDVQRGLAAVETLSGIQTTTLGEQLLEMGLIGEEDYRQLEHILNKLPVSVYERRREVGEQDVVYGKVAILNRFCTKDDVERGVEALRTGRAANMKDALIGLGVLSATEARAIDGLLASKLAADKKIGASLEEAAKRAERLQKIEEAVAKFFGTPLHLTVAIYLYEHPTATITSKELAEFLQSELKEIRNVLDDLYRDGLIASVHGKDKYIFMPQGKAVDSVLDVLDASRDSQWRRKIIELVTLRQSHGKKEMVSEWTKFKMRLSKQGK